MSLKNYVYTIGLALLLQSTAGLAAITISAPSANSVKNASSLTFPVHGTCVAGQILKISAIDSAKKSTALVWTQCQTWGFYVDLNISALKDGAIKVSVLQDAAAPQSAAVNIVKNTGVVVTPPTTPTNPTTPTTPVSNAVRILPLGDSLTFGYGVPGGYRQQLTALLNTTGVPYDFVGSLNDGSSVMPDKDHEGHVGWRIDQIDYIINSTMDAQDPDVVLLLIGGNDILQNYALSSAPQRVMNLIDKIRAKKPTALILVANIFLLPGLQTQITTFNTSLNRLVNQRTAAGQKVHLVDLQQSTIGSATQDGVHPVASGYNEIANRFFNKLVQVYN